MIFAVFGKRKQAASKAQVAPAAVDTLTEQELGARLNEVQALFDAGDLEGTRSLLQELAYSNPDNGSVQKRLGVCHALLGEYVAARGLLVSALEREPENTEVMKFLALSYMKLGETPVAARLVDRALEILPSDVELVRLRGDVYIEFGNFDVAAAQYNRALEIRPESEVDLHRLEVTAQIAETRVGCYELSPKIGQQRQRLVRRMLLERRKTGLDAYRSSVLLSLLSGTPETFPQALKLAQEMVDNELSTMSTESSLQGQLQRILQMAGDLPRSLLVSERFAAEDPDDPDRKFHLATAWISMGQERWAAGWRAVTEILTISRHYNHHHGVPIWEGQALGKRKLLVYQDQGVGDAILGFRFLPLLVRRGIRFELWVQPPLADLAACITGCDKVHRSTRVPDRRTHSCEFAITFFGLIAALYVGPDEIKDPPMVRPPADHAPELRERIRALPGKRIGLLYGGNPRRRDDWLRTVPVGSIAKLARLHGVSWVNLMVDERPDKAEAIAAFSMTDPMPQVSSFCDTAALVEELDAIVAVDASVAHVAGNLRKPLWVLAPPMRDWRWQIGEAPSPWWPTGRLVRCDSMGVWNQAVDRVFKEVGAFVAVPSGVGA